MRKRWAGLATTIAVLSSVIAVNGAIQYAKADSSSGDTWTVFAAGDIATAANNGGADEANAALIKAGIAQDPDHTRVLMLGDGAYPDGSYQTYLDQYDKTAGANDGWGQFKDKTYPAPGNHDYGQNMTVSDAGYRQYWDPILQAVNGDHGETSGDTLKDSSGWYSADIGPSWHVISLNWACSNSNPTSGGSQSGCSATDPQGVWLAGDLQKANAAHKHIIAMWHGARFVSGNEDPNGQIAQASGDYPKTDAYWGMLQKAGADIVLAGHHHLYERFDHMSNASPAKGDHQGTVDPTGPVSFVVGTGGGAFASFCGETSTNCPTDTARGSLKRIDHQYGVLKLVLHPDSYEFQFLAAGTGAVLDSSTGPVPTLADFGPGGTTDTTVTGPPATGPGTTPTTSPNAAPGAKGGYWMVGEDGKVYAFGAALKYGDAGLTPGTKAVKLEPTPTGNGYWVVDDAGGVSSLGDAVYRGAPDSLTLKPGEKVTSLSATPTGKGYWMFTDKGRVLPYGDAVSYGDMSATRLNAPVLGSIVTPSGKGYYMVAADGGIFSFGDAKFHGSMGGAKLNAPVESLVPTSDGGGYWLVASDGGIFAFGDAGFRGSMGGTKLSKPVTGMVRYADGYLMVAADGGIFDFSSSPFQGSLGGNPPAHPITSVAALP